MIERQNKPQNIDSDLFKAWRNPRLDLDILSVMIYPRL